MRIIYCCAEVTTFGRDTDINSVDGLTLIINDDDHNNNFYCATACNSTHGNANAFLSVCLSVCLSVKRVDVTKRKKRVPTFLHHTKDNSS